MKERYSVMRGEMAQEVATTNDLDEAKKLAKEFDDELSCDEWDNCENHWILDNETGCSIDIEY